ncbi:MAG: molybdopterin-dependent oxidoreductase [Alphaproteobacteria bacterium]|nr:molybdopterin-dependent oxidoreductase [Alphaproteobacteria bacterium]
MTRKLELSRRAALLGLGAGALSGCDQLSEQPGFRNALQSVEGINYRLHRLLLSGPQLAREYSEADISTRFHANGTTMPNTDAYAQLMEGGFASWRLRIDGLVQQPADYSLAQLRNMPSRTQITRHDCVEGWSAIGKWKGVPLRLLLQAAGLMPEARYIVFYCADFLGGASNPNGRYYESIDLVDAFHPQTILAYDMNDQALPVAHGAPLRLRVERQLGYKHAKYVMRIEAVASYRSLYQGRGGYWPDRGYEWYAGI